MPFFNLFHTKFFTDTVIIMNSDLSMISYISEVQLWQLFWKISLFATLFAHFQHCFMETIICMTPDLSIIYYILEMQSRPLL